MILELIAAVAIAKETPNAVELFASGCGPGFANVEQAKGRLVGGGWSAATDSEHPVLAAQRTRQFGASSLGTLKDIAFFKRPGTHVYLVLGAMARDGQITGFCQVLDPEAKTLPDLAPLDRWHGRKPPAKRVARQGADTYMWVSPHLADDWGVLTAFYLPPGMKHALPFAAPGVSITAAAASHTRSDPSVVRVSYTFSEISTVDDCRVETSSGDPRLDEKACTYLQVILPTLREAQVGQPVGERSFRTIRFKPGAVSATISPVEPPTQ